MENDQSIRFILQRHLKSLFSNYFVSFFSSESAYAEARPAALFQIFDDASFNLIYQNKLNIPNQIYFEAQIVPITVHPHFYYVPVQIETTNVWRYLWLSLKKMIYRFIYAPFHENFNDMIDKRWFTRWEKKTNKPVKTFDFAPLIYAKQQKFIKDQFYCAV